LTLAIAPIKISLISAASHNDRADLNKITLAWAVTIHKSHGSEYLLVIQMYSPLANGSES